MEIDVSRRGRHLSQLIFHWASRSWVIALFMGSLNVYCYSMWEHLRRWYTLWIIELKCTLKGSSDAEIMHWKCGCFLSAVIHNKHQLQHQQQHQEKDNRGWRFRCKILNIHWFNKRWFFYIRSEITFPESNDRIEWCVIINEKKCSQNVDHGFYPFLTSYDKLAAVYPQYLHQFLLWNLELMFAWTLSSTWLQGRCWITTSRWLIVITYSNILFFVWQVQSSCLNLISD